MHDFAISRAYYTMFYLAEALLLGKGLSFSKHSSVIAAFGNQFHDSKEIPLEFHRYLLDAQDSRITGDYDSHAHFTEEDVKLQIQRAKQFMDVAEKITKT